MRPEFTKPKPASTNRKMIHGVAKLDRSSCSPDDSWRRFLRSLSSCTTLRPKGVTPASNISCTHFISQDDACRARTWKRCEVQEQVENVHRQRIGTNNTNTICTNTSHLIETHPNWMPELHAGDLVYSSQSMNSRLYNSTLGSRVIKKIKEDQIKARDAQKLSDA